MFEAQERQLSFRWTSSAEVFHAPMLAPPGRAPGSPASAPASGTSTSASSPSCAQESSSSRTSKAGRAAGCARCGAVCKNSAIVRKPWGLAPQTSELRTSESGSSLWPTPTVSGEWNRSGVSSKSGDGLRTAVLWPTPTASQYGSAIGGAAGRVGPKRLGLAAAVKPWTTPTARDGNGPQRGAAAQGAEPLAAQARAGVGGQLNPEWVEILMGLPQGWTDVRDFIPTRRRVRPGRTPIGPASIIYGPPEEAKLSTRSSRRARSRTGRHGDAGA